MLVGLSGRLAGGGRAGDRSRQGRGTGERSPPSGHAGLPQFAEDLVQGAGVRADRLAGDRDLPARRQGALEAGWTALDLAVAGAAVAEWWKYRLTGRHLTAWRCSRTCSRPACWQRPRAPWRSSRRRLLVRAPPAEPDGRGGHRAHLSLGQRLSARVRRAGTYGDAAAALIVGHSLRRRRAGAAGIGRPAASPGRRAHGRAAGAAARGGGVPGTRLRRLLLQRGRGPRARPGDERHALRSFPAHLAMLAVAVAAVAAPWIAALGSGPTVASWPVARGCSPPC